MRVYGDDGHCAALFFDLDVKLGDVDRDERKLITWLAEAGARVITDESPSGGRHVYVPLQHRLPHDEAREMVEAVAKLFRTIDPSPHRSVRTGCIRVPGSRHVSGGHQSLTMSLNTAVDILMRPNGADVVEAMRIRLAPQITAIRTATQLRAVPDSVQTSPSGAVGEVPDGARRGLSRRITAIAVEGDWASAEYASGSEARFAVLCAAAASGWTLVDVVARVESGRWPGLAGLFSRYGARDRAALTADWHRAARWVAATAQNRASTRRTAPDTIGSDNVRISNTSAQVPHGGDLHRGVSRTDFAEDDHAFVRMWTAALRITEQHRIPGRAGYSTRFVLRALAQFAHMNGSRVIQVGVRALAIAAGCDHTTAAAALHAGADLGWCDRLEAGEGVDADTWLLTIPTDLRSRAAGMRWTAGKTHALRPAFRELGHVAALVFEALEQQRATTTTELVTTTGISRSAVSDALTVMQAWGLVDRRDGALHARPDQLQVVAEQLGVHEAVATQIRTYRTQRTRWIAYLTARAAARGEAPEHTDPDYWEPPDPETEPDDDLWWPPDDDWTLAHLAATTN